MKPLKYLRLMAHCRSGARKIFKNRKTRNFAVRFSLRNDSLPASTLTQPKQDLSTTPIDMLSWEGKSHRAPPMDNDSLLLREGDIVFPRHELQMFSLKIIHV